MTTRWILPAILASLATTTDLASGADIPPRAGDRTTQSPPRSQPASAVKNNAFFLTGIEQKKSLQQINRTIALDAANLIKAGRLDEASALLDESDKELQAFASDSGMELWDSTIAPILRLLDLRRNGVERARSAVTQPAGQTPTLRQAARLTPDQNRALTAIRADLNAAGGQIRMNKLVDAAKTLRSAESRLRALAGNAKVPIWSVPIASAFQLADTHRSELKARQAEAEEAEVKAAHAARSTTQAAADTRPQTGLPVGAPAPAFTALTIEGQPFSSQQFKGKWVLIDFWATWCGPCRGEIPFIRAAFEAFGQDKRLVILSLSEDSQIATAGTFAAQNQMHWAQGFIGEDSPVSQAFHVTGIPTILLIGPDGKVVANNLRGEEISKKLKEVLAPPNPVPTHK